MNHTRGIRLQTNRNIMKSGNSTWKLVKKYKLLYLFLLLPVALMILFSYKPMYGVIIAFKDFSPSRGILGSPWNNFAHFSRLFTDYYFWRIFGNTAILSVLNIIFVFPSSIIFALLMNEIKNLRFKKITQSISYLPNFISWVVISSLIVDFLSSSGPVNYVFSLLGLPATQFLTDPNLFRPILILSSIWQGAGWGSVIYLAALASVNVELYDSADIDGANRLQKAMYISLPSISYVVVIMLILNLGSFLVSNFDQIFNLYNPLVYSVADVFSTYIYRSGILELNYDYISAIGLFQNVVGIVLILFTNYFARKFSDYGIW